jgi:hypothetical protein
MTDVVVAAVEVVRVGAVHAMHPLRDISVGRLDEQMEVVRHQAPRTALPLVVLHDVSQDAEEPLAVEIVEKDGASFSPP